MELRRELTDLKRFAGTKDYRGKNAQEWFEKPLKFKSQKSVVFCGQWASFLQ
jgi:hypothetical protein